MPDFWLVGKSWCFLVAITAITVFGPWDNGDAAHLEDKSSSETWMEMNVAW